VRVSAWVGYLDTWATLQRMHFIAYIRSMTSWVMMCRFRVCPITIATSKAPSFWPISLQTGKSEYICISIVHFAVVLSSTNETKFQCRRVMFILIGLCRRTSCQSFSIRRLTLHLTLLHFTLYSQSFWSTVHLRMVCQLWYLLYLL